MDKVGFSNPNFAIIKKKAHATLKDIRLFIKWNGFKKCWTLDTPKIGIMHAIM
jgi:hypothetical protein